ncbi:MAG: integrase, partial [Mesorhizobium sp.]
MESYFRRRLTKQRNATPATVASYRDALRMLILFAAARLRKKPGALALEELIEISFSLFSTNSRRSGT